MLRRLQCTRSCVMAMMLASLFQLYWSERPALRRLLVECASAAMLAPRHFDSSVHSLVVAIGLAHRLRSIRLLCEQRLRFVLRLLVFILSEVFRFHGSRLRHTIVHTE